MARLAAPTLDTSVLIHAPAAAVFRAFFDHDALALWWPAVRAVTTPRVLGPFVVERATAEERDDVLGRLGGVFRGTIMHVDDGRGFFVADAYWLPPDGGPIGPMALEVTCSSEPVLDGPAPTWVRVRQNGFEEGARWRRYYEVAGVEWERALRSLQAMLEV